MARGIVRLVIRVRRRIQSEMHEETDHQSMFSRGLASEGYAGGYRDALDDVLLALNGVTPDRRGWWKERSDD